MSKELPNAKELTNFVSEYIEKVIIGFESGLYKMIIHNQKDRLKLLASKHHPFITIFRDLHENYYTTTFNSIVKRDDEFVTKTFDKFYELSGHSKQCILNVLANLIISIHFNLERQNLDTKDYDSYIKSLKKEIIKTTVIVNIPKLFDHECTGPKDSELKLISSGEKFITIKMVDRRNGANKIINSINSPT